MKERQHTLTFQGKEIPVHIRRDKRLKKYSRWNQEADGSILLRVPYRLPRRAIPALLKQIAAQLGKQTARRHYRTDRDLQRRAEYLNKKCFQGAIQWSAIRWVSNMNTRLGSCTTGGNTDGHIRISDKIRDWPQWVVDYVIAHELVHRLHDNHSPAFWALLRKGYPLTEQARGFIRGVSFAKGWEDTEEDKL